jgi:hypothetical protein
MLIKTLYQQCGKNCAILVNSQPQAYGFCSKSRKKDKKFAHMRKS